MTTTTRRVLRSQSRTNRSTRFNQLLELSCALSEDKDTKDKLETAEILSLLGVTSSNTTSTSARRASVPGQQPLQPQTAVPLPVIQHHVLQPRTLQPVMPQRLAPLGAARMPTLAAMPVLPAPGQLATAVPAIATTGGRRGSVSILPPIADGEKKRKRSKTTPEQLSILMEEFQREPMPNATTRQTLAARLGMTPRSVQVWFQNMRAKVKKTNAAAASGSAPGESKKSGSETDDGPVKKRQRVSANNEEKPENAQDKPQSRRNSMTGSVSVPQQSSASTLVPQPVVIAIAPQASFPTATNNNQPAGKLPLPSLMQHGQSILSMPLQLQFIPQSYHCDQIKRAMPAIAAHLAGSAPQQQMMA